MRKIIAGLFCCLMCNVYGAVLQGYGEVEHCYKVPDKSIPTCDGSAYSDEVVSSSLNLEYSIERQYCYIPSLGCNVPIEVEGFMTRAKSENFGDTRQEITPVSSTELGHDAATLYCKMRYPYEGLFYVNFVSDSMVPSTEVRSCNSLYDYSAGYACYQNQDDVRDPCEDEFASGAFFGEIHPEEVFLSALFVPETPVESLCDIGITKFKTSSGLEFQLYAEKYTTPSLVVLYNGQKCYGKLGQGRAQNTINLMFDGAVYHLE